MVPLTVLIQDLEVSARDYSGAAPPRAKLAEEGPANVRLGTSQISLQGRCIR
jgi:hypothetical protein